MELEWIRYTGHKGTRYLLILRLGSTDGTIHALACREIPGGEVDLIRALRQQLSTLSLGDRVEWLKRACPVAYKRAYRKLPESRVQVLQKY